MEDGEVSSLDESEREETVGQQGSRRLCIGCRRFTLTEDGFIWNAKGICPRGKVKATDYVCEDYIPYFGEGDE